MSILHTIFLGIVEGVTEFLPISSTAHIDIARSLMGVPPSEFIKSFEIIIQLGAILAVVALYSKKIFSSFKIFKNLIIAFIPTGIVGFALYQLIKSYLLGNLYVAALALLVGGIIIIIFERLFASASKHEGDQSKATSEIKDIESLSARELLILGTAQALAVIPGVSRSGAVIISGRTMGLGSVLIAEFSFLLAVPTMLMATAYDIYKSGLAFSKGEWGAILLGFIVSFIVALFVIKWLIDYIKKHSFKIFGWYRIFIGIALLLLLFLRII